VEKTWLTIDGVPGYVIVFGSETQQGNRKMPRVRIAPRGFCDYKIRISKGLRQKIERSAKQAGNSANQQMIKLIEQSLEAPSPASGMLEAVAKVLNAAKQMNDTTLAMIEKHQKDAAKRDAEMLEVWGWLRRMPQPILDMINADPIYGAELDRIVKGKADADRETGATLEPAE
jgi:hypothetical protein